MKSKGNLLQIAQLGEPVLRKKARTVTNFKDEKVQKLIDDLIATVKDISGTGLSAPQIYASQRIFVISSAKNVFYPKAKRIPVTEVINPKILQKSEKMEKNWEGCLSIPGIRAKVNRHYEIAVEYTDRKGAKHKKVFRDLAARVFQHEYDHLEGIIYLDRLDSNLGIVTEKEFQKLAKRKEKKKN